VREVSRTGVLCILLEDQGHRLDSSLGSLLNGKELRVPLRHEVRNERQIRFMTNNHNSNAGEGRHRSNKQHKAHVHKLRVLQLLFLGKLRVHVRQECSKPRTKNPSSLLTRWEILCPKKFFFLVHKVKWVRRVDGCTRACWAVVREEAPGHVFPCLGGVSPLRGVCVPIWFGSVFNTRLLRGSHVATCVSCRQ